MNIVNDDCLAYLPKIDTASVQLVYLDPPFYSQKAHSLRTRNNSIEYSFKDKWASLDEYLSFITSVLIECQRILKNDGSIFLHCDRSACHYLRVQLDKVFGADNFQSEIIWAYRRWSNSKKGLLNGHQNIYFYSKSAVFKFRTILTNYSPTTNIDQILQSRAKNEFGKSIYRRDKNGEIVTKATKKGVPLSDVWNIPYLNPKAHERVGYPTQKPVLLLERIIQLATDKGDLIVDPFCGSGTTLVAAQFLERNFLGIDSSPHAVELSKKRLAEKIKTESNLLKMGEDSYREKSDYERNILGILDAVPVERNKGIDGFLRTQISNHPVSVKIQKPEENLEIAKQKLIAASSSKNCAMMILIRTHTNNDCFFQFESKSENLLIIDSFDLTVASWINERGLTKSKPENDKSIRS